MVVSLLTFMVEYTINVRGENIISMYSRSTNNFSFLFGLKCSYLCLYLFQFILYNIHWLDTHTHTYIYIRIIFFLELLANLFMYKFSLFLKYNYGFFPHLLQINKLITKKLIQTPTKSNLKVNYSWNIN